MRINKKPFLSFSIEKNAIPGSFFQKVQPFPKKFKVFLNFLV